MSPLRLEAVYERVPQPWDSSAPAAVRWGLRASLGSDESPMGTASRSEAERAPEPRMIPERAASLPRSRGPRRGPREAETPIAETPVLAYTARGLAIPLARGVSATAGAGALMNLLA